MNAERGDKVDHIIQEETLNNRKINLRVVESSKNSSNRKGANSNNKTGVRNVNLVRKYNREIYRVQIMKKGERFKWDFELNEFDEACKFAELKRRELFGEYAGNG